MESDTLAATLGETGAGAEDFTGALVKSRPRLFRAALLLLGAREDAEDVTQRVLVRALEKRSRFRGDAEVYTWLYRILVNQCKDLFKARSRARRWLDPGGEVAAREVPAPGSSSEAALMEKERDLRLRRALDRLDPRSRTILVLRHYEDMSYEQMAEVLGCPVGTVRSRLSTARTRLRDAVLAEERQGAQA